MNRHLILVFLMLLSSRTSILTAQFCVIGSNGGLSFDGVNDSVTIPNNNVLDGASDFTIETWFSSPSQPQDFSPLIVKQATGTTQRPFLLSIHQGVVHISTNYDPGSGTGGAFAYGTTYLLGGWHHIAFRRQNSVAQVLVDGAVEPLLGYGLSLIESTPLTAVSAPIRFGEEPLGNTRLLGSLDEIRIWATARTDAEVIANMHFGLTGSEAGLVGYWRLDGSGALQTVQNYATATGAALDGVRGSSATPFNDDPSWISIGTAPLVYCSGSGVAQPNTAIASLTINGIGATGSPPYLVTIPAGGSITFNWSGPSNQPLILAASPVLNLNPPVMTLGAVNLGTSPLYQDVSILVDPLVNNALSFLFYTNALGLAQQSFTISAAGGALPPGTTFCLQGAAGQVPGTAIPVGAPGGTVSGSAYMTAAFIVTFL